MRGRFFSATRAKDSFRSKCYPSVFHEHSYVCLPPTIVLLNHDGVQTTPVLLALSANAFRWIETEREEALLGKGAAGEVKRTVAHEEAAFMALGHGPRVCPGQVR